MKDVLTKEDKADILLLKKKDKKDIVRSVWLVGIVQSLAIIGSMIIIFHCMIK